MGKAYKVRQSRHEDVKILADIIRNLGWFAHINEESTSATERRVLLHLELCDADECHTVRVAEDENGTGVGYISVHWNSQLILPGPEGYISEMFVREELRGVGIGALLMNDVKELAAAKGCSRLMLLNNRERSSYEREFYNKMGFEERPEMANLVLNLKPI